MTCAMLSILLQANDPATYPLVSLGVGGGIAALVISLWRQDRRDSQERYAKLAEESQERYAALAKESNDRAASIAVDFRLIVQENTKALTALSGKIDSRADVCAVSEMLVELIKRNKLINLEP